VNRSFWALFFVLITTAIRAQEDQDPSREIDSVQATELPAEDMVVQDSVFVKREEMNPLAPSKAAFYSAILPGLGQIYNKRYWKVPLVYAALGTGIYVYNYNDDLYDRFRTAFKRRRAGFTDDEFYNFNGDELVVGEPDLSDEALQDGQERYQRDRDLALVVTIALYALNIIDANVDSHLKQFNVDDNLSMDFRPYLEYNPITADPNYGMAITIKF
tara:strand:- start:19218 stop:19865 length:648 start_codon:yes stop_codon:yes gene_type:complete